MQQREYDLDKQVAEALKRLAATLNRSVAQHLRQMREGKKK